MSSAAITVSAATVGQRIGRSAVGGAAAASQASHAAIGQSSKYARSDHLRAAPMLGQTTARFATRDGASTLHFFGGVGVCVHNVLGHRGRKEGTSWTVSANPAT